MKKETIPHRAVSRHVVVIIALCALALGAVAGGAGMYLKSSDEAAPDPQKAGGPHAAHDDQNTYYTCSMHPEVVEHEPGTCPQCGMNLVAKTIAPDKTDDKTDDKAGKKADGKDTAKSRKIKHWVAPMDPTHVSDKPGKSPMGMDLVPVYEDGGGGISVTIDPVVVQNMGVRIAPVELGALSRSIRTIGTVDVAEDEVSVVNLRYSGWIESIYVDETGVKIKAGQSLFSVYSPEVASAQEEYLLALRTQGKDSPLAKSARRRLKNWDISNWQISRLTATGKVQRNVVVAAPRAGFVLHKNVVQGARVNAGADLYRIGNLDKIWVNADVYEFDAPWVAVGQKATMELSFQQGKTYSGKVSYIYPTLNAKTRTLKVRLEFDNPGLSLKPGMFATVGIESQKRDNATLVATEAILRSGRRQSVFVAIDLGVYELRNLTLGLVGDDGVTEVLQGVLPGERVVTSGQFLLDSESQQQEAVQKRLKARLHARQQQRKKSAGGAGKGDHSRHEHGDTYWTCSMHPEIIEDGPGTCPICGMDLVQKKMTK